MWILEGEGSRYQGLEWGGGRNNKRDLVLQEELQFVLFTVEKKKKKAHVEGVWAHRVFGAGRKREGEQGGHARAGGSQAGGRRGGSKDVAPHMVCITSSFLVVKINLKPFSPPPHPSSIDK